MKFIHLKPSDYATSTWSGGTTTQIGIAPAGAVYADRDFLWRISSATVDLEVSDFTALPDYDRLIATLEGEIDVTHNDGPVIHLAPYHVHGFDGGWNTRSVGRCTDFNLMTRKGSCRGEMDAVVVAEGETAAFVLQDVADAVVYCGEGSVAVQLNGETMTLETADSLVFQQVERAELTITGKGKLMIAKAYY